MKASRSNINLSALVRAFTVRTEQRVKSFRKERVSATAKQAAVFAFFLTALSISPGLVSGAGSGLYVRNGNSVLPPAEAEQVFAYITATAPYAKWPIMPGTVMFRQGVEPHEMRQNIHVNPVAFAALRAGAPELPAGSMLVKEVLNPDNSVHSLAVTYKAEGSGPEIQDRLWVRYTRDGKVITMGSEEGGCVSCHSKAAKRDFVLLKPGK